nr:hypothetical protein [Tanacetum cinerariifolium]
MHPYLGADKTKHSLRVKPNTRVGDDEAVRRWRLRWLHGDGGGSGGRGLCDGGDEVWGEVDVNGGGDMGMIVFVVAIAVVVDLWCFNGGVGVCACGRHQVNPKISHLHAVKRIFRLASASIFVKMEVLQIGISAMVIENKVETLTITTFLFPAIDVLQPLHLPNTALPPSLVSPMFDSRDFFPPKEILPKDTKTSELPTLVSPSSSIGSSSPVRSTTPPPDYPFDESIFAVLDNSLWIISRPLGKEPDLEEPNESGAYDHLWK